MTYKNIMATVLLSASLLGGVTVSANETTSNSNETTTSSTAQREEAHFTGLDDVSIVQDDEFDAKKGVKVVDANGKEVSADITVEGKVDTSKLGKTTLTYQAKVDDETITATRTVTVEAQKTETVTYNGQTMTLPVGPSQVSSEPKITEDTQGVMGQTAQKATQKGRTDVLRFVLGNTDVSDVDFIDVSSYQPNISVDTYKLMKSRGVKGVVVKLTEGTNYRNPYAAQQIANAQKAGLKVSAYHFSRFQNKSQAEAEARYFAAYANELGLPKSTVMVNDIESSDCNNGYATANSVYFALELINDCDFTTVLHYGYQSWFDTGVLNASKLGSNSIWIASYPYTPSKNDLWFKGQYEAWQFSSTMSVPGYTANTFDANIDYTGRFTQTVSEAHELDDFYLTISSKGHNIYSDKALSAVKQSTSDVYHKTFIAKRYYEISGVKYYSIYDKNDKWQGYVSEKYVKLAGAKKQGGAYFGQDGKYGVVKKANYTLWNDLDFGKKKGTTKGGEFYQVKGLYYHFNGSTYASVYDNNGKWKGYLNIACLNMMDNDFGEYHSYNKYVTIAKKGYGIFKDKHFKKKVSTSDKKYHKTYLAKGYYDRFDGTRYYSLYSVDNSGKETWEGYIRSTATKMGLNDGKTKGGAFFSVAKSGKVVKSNYTLWNDFDYSKKRGNTTDWLNKTVYIHGEYFRIDGRRYYTIYDKKDGKWLGYVNQDAVKVQ